CLSRVGEAHCQQDRLQLLSEKRKWQTEMENKRRQLEDDRRALQHLKSKALRERWLLDGAPSAGPEQDDVKTQLERDEARTRSLEETISRLEEELRHLETGGVCENTAHATVSTNMAASGQPASISLSTSRCCTASQTPTETNFSTMTIMITLTHRAVTSMYSVEIKVERDRVTGETRVLSTNTTLPIDLSHQGVKVYEDEQKVVHEMNGEDGIQLLSCSEVDELIHKADEASMMSQTVATVTSLPTVEVQEGAGPQPLQTVTTEMTGLEAKAGVEPSVAEASAEKPITMVFMGYQSVEDEDETKRVLGLQGTVKAELVLLDDTDTKTSPAEGTEGAPPSCYRPPEAAAASNGGAAAEAKELKGGAVEVKKEKQPCKCCSIM
uniref:Paralemmin-1 n=1 Tax=Mola mola TaxID=94237 RepID=A0A3Q3WE11_MOLML